ncbi:WAP four-disulfide core domain protein 3 [Cuculus canorus]|uniref:WAP four-disulfide core domain protein 3 n=1 Tax=Cuculus canorus TaxID=55661 RepID=UPI0023AAF460|nr:WAP four-disulfide core domain protein 3 [Cuculus canorus]
MGRSSSAWLAPALAGFKSLPAGTAEQSSDSSTMPGECSLLLVLLVLSAELPPTPAQEHRDGDQGSAPVATPARRRAPRGRWSPAILPVPGKAGECPAGRGVLHPAKMYCLFDHDCPGTEKCCQSGQMRTCMLPTAESPGYCPRTGSINEESCGLNCHNDTMCSPGEKCCTRSCCARCTRAEPAKPGLCPRKRIQRITTACLNRCADDRDCPGEQKCCFSGCGLACIPPDTGSRRVAVKPGVCPEVLRGSLGPCLQLCDTDGRCPGAAKCCHTGCGQVCKPPTEVRPGRCPSMADGDRAAECHLLCLQDRDCPPGHKCCLRDCGRACVPLEPAVPPVPAALGTAQPGGDQGRLVGARVGASQDPLPLGQERSSCTECIVHLFQAQPSPGQRAQHQ